MGVFRTLLMQQDVYNTIYGTNSITFNAKANSLKALTLFGGTEQSGTPTPTTPQDIVCNNGALKYSNNLLDMATENIVLGKYINNSGVVSNSGPNFYNSKYIPVVAGETYTWSTSSSISYFSVMEYDSSYVFKKRTLFSNAGTSGSITLRSDAAFVLIGSNMDSADITLDKIAAVDWQFEKGSSATAYKPYSPTGIYTDGTIETVQDSLSNTATAEMLLKVGNYQDVQSVLDGEVTRNVGIKVFDGTESFAVINNTFRYNLTGLKKNTKMICSHFDGDVSPSVTTSNQPDLTVKNNASNNNNAYFKYAAKTTIADFQQWLADRYNAGTPVIIIYPLATSTTETVTGQTLTTKEGTNTISITQASISSLDLEAKFKKEKEINTYYAYTDSNNNTIYSKDSLASASFTLQNITNTNCTDLGNGVYRGGSGKYLTMTSTPAIASANSWEFKTKVRYVPTNGYSCIFGCSANDCQTPIFGHITNNQMYALLSSNGSSWDLYYTVIKDINTSATLTLVNDTTYYFKFGFTGSEYYLWYSTVGWNDTGTTLTYLRTTTKVFCADPLMLLNNNFSTSGYYWGGDIDLSETSLIIDNTTTTFGAFIGNQLYNSSFQALTTDYKNGTGIIATNMENGALIVPTTPFTTSMEMQVHFKTNTNWSNLQLTGGADDVTHNSIYFQNYDSILVSWASSNGTTHDILSNFYVAYNMYNLTEYWLKTIWDGTKYDFYLSTDGTNFTNTSSQTSSSPVFWNNNPLYLGNKADKSITQCYKQYYLDGTYIKCDGVTVFDGATTLKSDLNSDGCTLSGERKSDVIINSTVYYRNPSKDVVRS